MFTLTKLYLFKYFNLASENILVSCKKNTLWKSRNWPWIFLSWPGMWKTAFKSKCDYSVIQIAIFYTYLISHIFLLVSKKIKLIIRYFFIYMSCNYCYWIFHFLGKVYCTETHDFLLKNKKKLTRFLTSFLCLFSLFENSISQTEFPKSEFAEHWRSRFFFQLKREASVLSARV